MIADTIDILDAEIVNFGIDYEILIEMNTNRYNIINVCNQKIMERFGSNLDIGEPIMLTDVFRALQSVPGVLDVTSVVVDLKAGGIYSEGNYDFQSALSSDGRRILAEPNIIFELKYPNVDIRGSIK